MDNYKQLADIIEGKAKKHINAAVVWAKVKEVDWNAKTMTATGLTDGLDYFDVKLGAGYRYRKPKQNSLVLLSVIENQPSATALLFAEEVEEEVIQSGDTMITINEQGLTIEQNGENLFSVLSDMIDELNKIVVVQGNTINVAAMNQIKQRFNNILK